MGGVKKSKGYTLFEILFVVTLFGLIAGISSPRIVTLYESVKWANERDDVIAKIAELGLISLQNRVDFELKEYPSKDSNSIPFELPSGWSLKADPPIQYKENGVCLGGKLELAYKEKSIVVVLSPPLGTPELNKNVF